MIDAADLSVVVTSADGTSTRFGPEGPSAQNVPSDISFRTQRMGGFADASFTLPRRIDAENTDIRLGDDVAIVSADGTTVYEGYVDALPRSFSGSHSLSVSCTGWIGHAQDRTFTEVYVDRDLSAWRDASRARLGNLAGTSFRQTATSVSADQTNGVTAIIAQLADPNWVVAVIPCSECWYDTGVGLAISQIYYDWQRPTDTLVASAWQWNVSAWDADDGTLLNSTTANLKATSSTPAYFTPTTPARFGRLFFGHTTGPNTGSDGLKFGVYWTKIAVYGNTGVPLIGTTDPLGVAASDVIKHIAGKYAPLLNTSGVQATTYPIPHLAFKDRITAYDAWLDVNKYHLWNLQVWENKTLTYKPADLTDYDWEIRTDEPGTDIGLQGDAFSEVANGVTVMFDNVLTGTRDTLTPDVYSDLLDPGVSNPATTHGRKKWTDYSISFPTTPDAALQIGRAYLAEYNAPKTPGSITKTGLIRDRAGHLQPVSRVRAGDRVAITSSVNYSDRPRQIQETSYSHSGRQMTIGVDGKLPRLEGFVDRVTTALAAANLS